MKPLAPAAAAPPTRPTPDSVCSTDRGRRGLVDDNDDDAVAAVGRDGGGRVGRTPSLDVHARGTTGGAVALPLTLVPPPVCAADDTVVAGDGGRRGPQPGGACPAAAAVPELPLLPSLFDSHLKAQGTPSCTRGWRGEGVVPAAAVPCAPIGSGWSFSDAHSGTGVASPLAAIDTDECVPVGTLAGTEGERGVANALVGSGVDERVAAVAVGATVCAAGVAAVARRAALP